MMFARIRRGWRIAKASWALLQLHPKLLIFPLISGPLISGPLISGPLISGPLISGPLISGPLISGLTLMALIGAIGVSMY
jgi:hypothetical protein